jgi:hypothetical protein
MPGLIIDGREEQVPGLTIVNYKDNPNLKLKPGHSMRARHTRWVRSIGLHNTKNVQTSVAPGAGPSKNIGEAVVRFWSTDPNPAGAHIIVDWDATIYCLADLLKDAAYHMGTMNEVSIGIEIYESSAGMVYDDQLQAVVTLVKWLCSRFRIQMQLPTWSDNSEIARIKAGGEDCVGVFGHCHNYYKGKAHDPGFDIMKRLATSGFKEFNFYRKDPQGMTEDIRYWRDIQTKLGLRPDGVPGPKTCDALQALGFANGIYDFSTVI